MRAILIDAEKRTLREISLADGEAKTIRATLGCDSFTTGAWPLNGSMAKGYDTIFVSNDDTEGRDPSPQFWFQVDADCDPPSSYPIAGNGLVLGIDEVGASCDASIPIDELTPRIAFTRRKIRGFVGEDGSYGTRFAVDGPIITDATRGSPSIPSRPGCDAATAARMRSLLRVLAVTRKQSAMTDDQQELERLADALGYTDAFREAFGKTFATCLSRGMEPPFTMCCVAANGACVIYHIAPNESAELLAERTLPDGFQMPINVMVVDQRGEAARMQFTMDGKIKFDA